MVWMIGILLLAGLLARWGEHLRPRPPKKVREAIRRNTFVS